MKNKRNLQEQRGTGLLYNNINIKLVDGHIVYNSHVALDISINCNAVLVIIIYSIIVYFRLYIMQSIRYFTMHL